MTRSRTGVVLGALIGAALMAAAGPAAAQISSGGGPISYSANDLQYFNDRRQLVLSGDVEIAQGEATLRSDRLTLIFAPGSSGGTEDLGSGDIERIIAEGEVYYVRTDQTAKGDRAVYETASDTVTFTGDVVIATPDNVIQGERLELQIGSGRATIKPSGEGGRRVRGVFSARQNSTSN